MDSEDRAIRYIFVVCLFIILAVWSYQIHRNIKQTELISAGFNPVCVAGSVGEVNPERLLLLINYGCKGRSTANE